MGIVGLPGTGKTMLFNALTGARAELHSARPHVGMAPIGDDRVERVAAIVGSSKATPAAIRVQDVPGAGGALLGPLRQADALLACLDGFSPGADPGHDLETLRLELLVADRDHVEKRLDRVRVQAKSGERALREEVERLESLLAHLEGEHTIPEFAGAMPGALEPLTTKPLIPVVNGPAGVDLALEAELAELSDEEAAEFREGPSALAEVVGGVLAALDLISFFTANEKEARAWTLRRGQTAIDAAAQVHTDMARGFIRCEVVRLADLVECGSRAEASRRGLARLEGKGYIVEEGDVLQVRFSV